MQRAPQHTTDEPHEPYVFRYTCRQVFHEARALYYALNILKLRKNSPYEFGDRHLAWTSLKQSRIVSVDVCLRSSWPSGFEPVV